MAESSKQPGQQNEELLKKIEEALKFKSDAQKKAKEWHYRYFCHLSPWIRLPISLLVDFVDGILGAIQVVDMAGTFITTCAAYVLWGDMGFIAAWEFLPRMFQFLHRGEKEKKSRFMGWMITLTPTVFIVGILTIIKEHRDGHVINHHGIQQGVSPQIIPPAIVVSKRELDPAWRELGRSISDRLGMNQPQSVIKRQLDPDIRLLFCRIRDWIKNFF